MLNDSWKNPWKITSLALALVGATALATGLVVANWGGKDTDRKAADVSSSSTTRTTSRATDSTAIPAPPRASTAPTRTATATAPVASTAPTASTAPAPSTTPAVPTQAVIEACNHYAATESGQRDKTVDTVKDAGIGAVAGAVLGAAGGAIAGGGKGAGQGAAIGGIVGAGGGTLYGLNENKKHDERYREAYAACMRGRGYTG